MTMGPLLSFYGDDFTGSTDALEVLAWAGLKVVLFVDPPNEDALRSYGALDAFGVAGTSRTMSPEELDIDFRSVLECISRHRTPITHYKTCSTFDSAPHVGSIGRVMEIARDYFSGTVTPIIVGAPALGRYMLFGNLYARAGLGGDVFRLDRHPTMSAHPVTPMDEADLLLHLQRQTGLKIGLVDYLQLGASQDAVLKQIDDLHKEGHDAIFWDVAHEGQLEKIGALLMELAARGRPLFVVGSSGVEYSLVAARGRRALSGGTRSPVRAVECEPVQVLCISGSCSPVTAEQIEHARDAGFAIMHADPAALIDPAEFHIEVDRLLNSAREAFVHGRSVIVETASGPRDPRVDSAHRRSAQLGIRNVTRAIALATAELTDALVESCRPSRLVIAGGDTSSLSAKRIGVQALEAIAPIAPGGPLCRAHAPGRFIDGREVVFKGGQVGRKDFFTLVRTVQALTPPA